MQYLEGSGTPVLYVGHKVLKGEISVKIESTPQCKNIPSRLQITVTECCIGR
jgi:hypothetical protein